LLLPLRAMSTWSCQDHSHSRPNVCSTCFAKVFSLAVSSSVRANFQNDSITLKWINETLRIVKLNSKGKSHGVFACRESA
jgi:hypothetical protein